LSDITIIIKFNTTLAINLIDVSIYAFFVSLFNINRISYKNNLTFIN